MEELKLTDAMQRYFSDFFVVCDENSSGKVPVKKVLELIRSGNVNQETVNQVGGEITYKFVIHWWFLQIAEMCWSQGTSYLNRKQFYSALKLVAAQQVHIPLRSELLTNVVDLPLPRYLFNKNHFLYMQTVVISKIRHKIAFWLKVRSQSN